MKSSVKCYFDCNKCYHISNGDWCPYCSGKLCDDFSCVDCNRSFASCTKSMYWSEKKLISPRYVIMHTNDKYIFYCYVCNHEFISAPNQVSRGILCPYCNWCELCDDELCNFCNLKSFASHPYVKYFSIENKINPRQICKSSGKKY